MGKGEDDKSAAAPSSGVETKPVAAGQPQGNPKPGK
jgi:hypothetical protein